MINDQLSMITPHTPLPLGRMIIRYPGFRPGLSSTGPTARMGSTPRRSVGPLDDSPGRNPGRGETLGEEPPHPNVPGSMINESPPMGAGICRGVSHTPQRVPGRQLDRSSPLATFEGRMRYAPTIRMMVPGAACRAAGR